MPRNIDVNRGVTIRKHQTGGFQVYMYKDQPGVFLNAFGKPVSAKVAAQAGFDTETLLRQKERMERMSNAMSAVDREMQMIDDEEKVVLYRRGEYEAVQRPLGRAQVYDADGNCLTPLPIPKEEAKILLEYLVPGDDVAEPKKREKALERGEKVEEGKTASKSNSGGAGKQKEG